jgi:hypothetical protein
MSRRFLRKADENSAVLDSKHTRPFGVTEGKGGSHLARAAHEHETHIFSEGLLSETLAWSRP